MKKWFNKIKTNFKNATKGFSLVELIVVIAIMAVMAAVLAPALLGYVERSRAQKDDSAMGEVTNAIKLSLADQNVYDELLPYTVKGNFSCYADGDASTNTDDNKIITKSPDYWLFNDECRKLDETPYQPAGSMRGVTITLKPNGSAEYILKDGIINQTGDSSTAKGAIIGKTLNDAPEVYNRLRSTVGDTIKVSSQTYRNSTYTIFISMGTTGGNQADKQDAIQVYGQYNGTNLPEVMTATGSASQDKGNAGSSDSEGGEGTLTPAPVALTTLTAKTWSEPTSFSGSNIWTDGANIYCSFGSQHYILQDGVWERKVWKGLTSFGADAIWTDGTHIYHSGSAGQYVLDGDTWKPKTWNGLTNFYGNRVWSDGINVYFSDGTSHYILNGDTWEPKTWNGLTSFDGGQIWTSGTNIYRSIDSHQYVLNGDTWESKAWSGLTNFSGHYIWTDGANTYYSQGSNQYVLNGDTWEQKMWEGHNNISGSAVWTDGVNYYYSVGPQHYVFS